MPPAAIRSRVSSTASVCPWVRRSSSADAGGNLGAPPKPPFCMSASRAQLAHRVADHSRVERIPRRLEAPDRRQLLAHARRRGADLLALGRPRLDDRLHDHPEARHALARLGREVGAAVERDAVGVQERGQRPAAVAGDALHGLHVDRVEVGALLAVHLDGDEVGVHERRGVVVLERLALHHVAPVAGRVADREQDRLVLASRSLERLGPPRVPVDRVLGVLEEVGAGLVREAVGHRIQATRGWRNT